MRESTEISRKVGPGGPQKKLKKIMEKALEKFRLSTPISTRSDLLMLRNRDLKIGTFLKKINFELCFYFEVQKYIKDMFVWAENVSDGISWWVLLIVEISGWSSIFVLRLRCFKMTHFEILILNFSFASARILLNVFWKKAAFYSL